MSTNKAAADAFAAHAWPIIWQAAADATGYRSIADATNASGVRAGARHDSTVRNLLARAKT